MYTIDNQTKYKKLLSARSAKRRAKFLLAHPELDNKDWLIKKHCVDCISMVELATMLNVTPTSVKKSLVHFDIKSPSQQQLREASLNRKYGVTNSGNIKGSRAKALNTMTKKYGGHVWSVAAVDKKAQRDATMMTKYGTIVPSQNTKINRKQRSAILSEPILQKLESKSWLCKQYVTLNKSITEISRILGVTDKTVINYMLAAGIQMYRSSLPLWVYQLLTDLDWLYQQHYILKKSMRMIATELLVGENTVYKYANAAGLNIIRVPTLSLYVYEQLNNPQWLADECITKSHTYKQLADKLDVCSTTVAAYCNYYGIASTGKHMKMPNKTYNKLNNPIWLRDQHHIQQKPLVQIAAELGFCDNTPTNSGTLTKYMRKHNIPLLRFPRSTGEIQVSDYVSSILSSKILYNNRTVIPPYELDIYIPSHKIAIEYNGLYWHSEQQGKDKWYHYNKWKDCNNKGIQLITIFEDEWTHKQAQVKLKLASLLGCDSREIVYARKCTIVEVNNPTKITFFNDNHIQGSGPGSINIGLEYNNELVACMTFIKQKDKHYLNRYATSHRVPGGFGKLLKHFQNEYDWKTIISFADNRWSGGNLYHKTGWELDIPLPPDYSYIQLNNRIHKFNFRRKFLVDKLDHFNPELSEWENCKANGVLRIWDCGKQKFKIQKDKI